MSHEREYKDTWEYRLESAVRRAEQAERALAECRTAYGKLFNSEARLTGELEDARATLAEKEKWIQDHRDCVESLTGTVRGLNHQVDTLRATLARVERERDEAENKADNLRKTWDREHAVLTAARDGLQKTLRQLDLSPNEQGEMVTLRTKLAERERDGLRGENERLRAEWKDSDEQRERAYGQRVDEMNRAEADARGLRAVLEMLDKRPYDVNPDMFLPDSAWQDPPCASWWERQRRAALGRAASEG